jgi:hypothetical protein
MSDSIQMLSHPQPCDRDRSSVLGYVALGFLAFAVFQVAFETQVPPEPSFVTATVLP